MKKLLVAILAVILMSLPSMASTDGGKKKARKKAKIECKKDSSCEVKSCDPKNCDPKNCPYPSCTKDEKCATASTCSGNK